MTTSKPSLNSAIFSDILVRFYTGEPGGFFAPQPIGMATAGRGAEDTPIVSTVVAKEYSRGIKKLNDTGRNALKEAAALCLSRTHYNVEIEHFLLELMGHSDSDFLPIIEAAPTGTHPQRASPS